MKMNSKEAAELLDKLKKTNDKAYKIILRYLYDQIIKLIEERTAGFDITISKKDLEWIESLTK